MLHLEFQAFHTMHTYMPCIGNILAICMDISWWKLVCYFLYIFSLLLSLTEVEYTKNPFLLQFGNKFQYVKKSKFLTFYCFIFMHMLLSFQMQWCAISFVVTPWQELIHLFGLWCSSLSIHWMKDTLIAILYSIFHFHWIEYLKTTLLLDSVLFTVLCPFAGSLTLHTEKD